MLGPPDGVTPERLFRSMLQVPRATVAVNVNLPCAVAATYTVRALSPLEDSHAIDIAMASGEAERGARLEEELVAACLYEDGARAFGDGLQLADLLDELEFSRLRAVVLPALHQCSPSYRRSDHAAWFSKLCMGAIHGSNQQLSVPLAQCFDGGYRGRTPRPDRYFGGTIAEITDGQWLAYRAAHQMIIRAREHD